MRNLITLKKLLFACTFMFICISGFSQTLDIPVNTSSDDAEEDTTSGAMDLTSTDTELCDDSGNQLVGLRFQNVTVPQGSTITNAYIQFKSDANDTNALTITIQGIDADNTTTFTTATDNISDRIDGDITSGTTATASWNPAAWTNNAQGVAQRTASLNTIVKEIVDRAGWASGNAMGFVFTSPSTSERSADTYDTNGDSTESAILHIEYTPPPGPDINLVGNGNNIADGSTSSSPIDNTRFNSTGIGVPVTHTFTIQNTGTTLLTLSGAPLVSISGDPEFTVTAQPGVSTIAAAGSTTFTVQFMPTDLNDKTATISIASDDPNENPYTFEIEGLIPGLSNFSPGGEWKYLDDGTDQGTAWYGTGFVDTAWASGDAELGFGDGDETTVVADVNQFTTYFRKSFNVTAGEAAMANMKMDLTYDDGAVVYVNGVEVWRVNMPGGAIGYLTPASSDSGDNATASTTIANSLIVGTNVVAVEIHQRTATSSDISFDFDLQVLPVFLINSGGSWSYLDDGTDQGTAWQTADVTPSGANWPTGNAMLGYGVIDGGTIATTVGFVYTDAPTNSLKNITTYFRKTITVPAGDIANSTLVMRGVRDDGMVVYIDGVEVWRDNMPFGTINYTSPSAGIVSGTDESAWNIEKIANPFLVAGTHEIAVEVHQRDGTSSDLSFDFEMYTNNDYVFTPPPAPDTDGDLVADYVDADDDNDGVPDVIEGCQSGQFEDLNSDPFGAGAEESILADFPFSKTLGNGNQIDYSITGTFTDITSYDAGEQGWSIRVSGPSTSGTLIMDFVTDVDDLFLKLVDFDENETWTVNAYDDTNTLIDLTVAPNIYHVGSIIDHSGNTFSDANSGGGTNYVGDNVTNDQYGAVYLYFPGISISRIEFIISQPDGSTIRLAGMQYCVIDTDGDGIDDTIDQDSDNDGIPDLVESGGYDTDGNGIADDLTDIDGDGLADIYDNDPSTYFIYETSTINFGDLDGDGVDNRIDLDSDNDGIVDIREAGEPDTNGDGQIDGFTDANNDGYHDAFDGVSSILITGADGDADGIPDSYPNDNQDANGFPDFIDIDADNDGITDNTEAQATGSFVAFVITDTDGDGIPNVFDNTVGFGGNGFTPEDTDGDSIPDYLDTDSDDGDEPDNIEGHDTNGDGVVNGSDSPNADTGLYVGTDTDGDGLDDGFDNNDGAFDPTNGTLQATSHPIFDAGTDRDWRYTFIAIDFDGANDFIDFGDEVAYEFSGSFSLEAWVLQETSTGTRTVVSKSNIDSGNERGYELSIVAGVPTLKFFDSSGSTVLNINTSPHTLSLNQWHHIASTFDGTTARIYVDGIDLASGSPSASIGYGSENFLIGATYDGATPTIPTNNFNGYIDEIRVWNTALTVNQMREMMNQEIQQSTNGPGTGVMGTVVPLDISGGLLWANLEGYYTLTGNDADDDSSYSRDGSARNITTLMPQTAPLPYTTKADGDWADTSGTTPWTYGDSVWDAPNSVGIDGSTTIDWNIVETNHNVTIDTYTSLGREREVLGLIVASNDLQVNGVTSSGTGNGLTVNKYLKLDGTLDLEGESQLIQSDGSVLDATSSGTLERDQQGNSNLYLYNYWCSPVGVSNTTTNNNSYTLPDIITNAGFLTSGLDGNATPNVADYWIWKYANLTGDEYSLWQHVRSTGSLDTGEGFTMKGTGTASPEQNYIFEGKPNNGDFTLTVSAGNEYLVGNPYPSAMDADEFIMDNISATDGGKAGNPTNVINGALYFWDHFANNSHKLAAYEGGYATYTLMGGAVAISNDTRINASGQVGTMTPQRYIPVGQGFFVSAIADASLVGAPNDPGITLPVVGGNIQFKNSQRVFMKEGPAQSIFVKNGSKKSKSTASKNVNTDVDTRQKIKLMYDSPDGYHRQLLVGVDENASNGFDLGYDAPLAESNKEDMYWEFNNSAKLIIQAVNNFDTDQILPLGLKTDKEGFATIKIDALENISTDTNIFVHDKETEIYHNLRESDFQVYLDNVGEHSGRFEITFDASQAALSVDDFEKANIEVYFSNENKSFIVHNPDLKYIESISVYNLLGQSIYEFESKSQGDRIEYKTKNINTGIYIVKMKIDNEFLSKKILVK